MPYNRPYRRRSTRGRRRTTGTMSRYRAGPDIRSWVLNQAATAATSYARNNWQRVAAGMVGHAKKSVLTQTKARTRGPDKQPRKQRGGASKNIHRHEKLSEPGAKPMNKGKGFQSKAHATVLTHPRSSVPKWKHERLEKYKEPVWQTVYLSRSNRLAASNNTLETCRYPIKAPECLDSERTQTMLFTPFCSNFSGTHTTMYRHVNAAGTALVHANGANDRLDVVQRKVDKERHNFENSVVEANDGSSIQYAQSNPASAIVSEAQTNSNMLQVKRYADQLVKGCNIDLVFTASRAFPVIVSVSVVRITEPTEPFTLTTADTQQMCNGTQNKGMDYTRFKTEWHTEFTLGALRVNKRPPTQSVNAKIISNFLQTNSFNENTVASDMAEAGATQLGKNIHSHTAEVADGFVSGAFYVLIKYRKKQQPQQFTYTQTIASQGSKSANAQITLPVVSEESFDIPSYTGGNDNGFGVLDDGDGKPVETGVDESKASFYVHGKLQYHWGFRHQTEAIPSVYSRVDADTNYKKPLSLMIDPTYLATDTTYGLYQASPDNVKIAADTSVA